MPKYMRNTETNGLQISFERIPDESIRTELKKNGFRWNAVNRLWYAKETPERLALVERLCGVALTPARTVSRRVIPKVDYALKLKIGDIVNADRAQLEEWECILKQHVNGVMSEDNSDHAGNTVSKSQESVWMNCFMFIAENLAGLSADRQNYELIFEYSLPGTVHERPDVFLLTNRKALSLEFKRKDAPQIDSNKDDVAQAIRYREWLQNHHKVTRDRHVEVVSYLVCTHENAVAGNLRGIEVITKENFCDVIEHELAGEEQCSFMEEWLGSARTEMPDMLQAIEIMYREGRIPYISDVNEKCLKAVLRHIDNARRQNKKVLILINGVPGAGKTAVGQSVVYEENKGGEANAVYLSGNGPLVEVLQYQINQVGNNEHVGENAIQGMKGFKASYFSSATGQNTKVPQQSILIFDEAQRAWDARKLERGFSEPQGLFDTGERIYQERGYAVLIGLYGDGQVIYTGEEAGLSLWEEALQQYDDWFVVVADGLSDRLRGLGSRKIVDNDVFLPVSLRADFIDCSKWVEQAIGRCNTSEKQAKEELEKLQSTSMRISVTRDFTKIKRRTAEIDGDHPEWKYGILISNFAEQSVVVKAMPGWNIGYKGANTVNSGAYGQWFAGESKELTKACSVYGNQGLELDCPIILFGGGYVRQHGFWKARGSRYERDIRLGSYQDPDTIVENNFRVLLTRARKEMILFIPRDSVLDETYQYFLDMGMDEL